MPTNKQLQDLQASRRYGIGRLLLLARRNFLGRLDALMGGDNLTVIQARGRLLPYLDVHGTRGVDIARRMGISKQAVARLVKELEDDGLVHREPDGADGRAFLVRFTPEGLVYLRKLHRCIEQIEREYEVLVGTSELKVMRDALTLIAYGAGEEAPPKD